MNKLQPISILCFFVFLAACQPQKKVDLPYYKDPSFTPYWLKKGDKNIADFHAIPAFELINQDGDTIRKEDFLGKLYVADFFFTRCPGICPKMTENMKRIQDAFLFDDGVLLISHSVTPQQDSVSVLQRYAIEKGAVSGKWHLVTGDRELIYTLGRKAYFVEEDLGLEKKASDFIHTENFILIDGDGHIRGIYNGLNSTAVQQLIKDIKQLKTAL